MKWDVPSDYIARLKAVGISGLRLNSTVSIHNESQFEPPCFLGGGLSLHLPIKVGAFTLINGARIGQCTIGRYCSLAANVTIGAAEHPIDRITSSPITFDSSFHDWDSFYDPDRCESFKNLTVPFKNGRRPTIIGNDVWLGHGVFVKAGVTIGTGAVVGAGAVVTTDIEPYAIAVGIPARVVRYRFSADLRSKLLSSRWWEYSIYDLLGEEIVKPDSFIEILERRKSNDTIKVYSPIKIDSKSLKDLFK